MLKTKTGTKIRTMAMIDSGCTHTCIGEKMVKKENIPTQKLLKSMTARNADGSVTGNKQIMDFVEVEMVTKKIWRQL
jgi:predicted aspartyl protease